MIRDEGGEPESLPSPVLNHEESWSIWMIVRAFDWKALPYSGGLLDQPDWLLNDLLNLESEYRRLRDEIKPNG